VKTPLPDKHPPLESLNSLNTIVGRARIAYLRGSRCWTIRFSDPFGKILLITYDGSSEPARQGLITLLQSVTAIAAVHSRAIESEDRVVAVALPSGRQASIFLSSGSIQPNEDAVFPDHLREVARCIRRSRKRALRQRTIQKNA
jgi:hypothetical protein